MFGASVVLRWRLESDAEGGYTEYGQRTEEIVRWERQKRINLYLGWYKKRMKIL